MALIKLQYFQQNGQWHGTGAFETESECPVAVLGEIEQMRRQGTLPGLGLRAMEYYIQASLDELPSGMPTLITPHPLFRC